MFSSARKVLLMIFWDSEGVVHTEQGNTVNSTKYVNTLEKLKVRLRRVSSEKVSIKTTLALTNVWKLVQLKILKTSGHYRTRLIAQILLRAISSFFQNSRITSRATVTRQTKM
ncbi:transposase [Elysia marginata]|uniref:Transposase n=1 Tax=Elysia marginata TaxID=1093978 RepID=A0AAV4JBM1_9GAST|nr:transposase [Elysia marginata]